MCNTSNNNLSFKERVQCYINKRDEIINDYKNRLHALTEEACADILANCPIKIGDVYTINLNTAFGVKRNYYKVAKLDADVNGMVSVYGCKRKLDKTWDKRDNIYMYTSCMYDDYSTGNYAKVENYVEPSKD